MRKRECASLIGCLIVAVVLFSAGSGMAADKYPSRMTQVVFGFEPGSTDLAVRPFTDKLQAVLGQPMEFVYKPGAGAAIGALYVAKSKPDGYTLMGASMNPLILTPLTKEGLGYTLNDFTPLCLIASATTVLTVKADSRWKSMQEIIEESKKSPGKITYSTSGVFGTTHIPMEMLQKFSGARMTHIPTTGSGPVVAAVLGGHVDFGVTPIVAVSSQIRAGQLRAVAIIGKERRSDLPNVPTIAELGYPVFYNGWFALVGPKGMPADVVATLNRACDKVKEVNRKAVEDQLLGMQLNPELLTGAAFADFLKAQNDVTKAIIAELKKPGK